MIGKPSHTYTRFNSTICLSRKALEKLAQCIVPFLVHGFRPLLNSLQIHSRCQGCIVCQTLYGVVELVVLLVLQCFLISLY